MRVVMGVMVVMLSGHAEILTAVGSVGEWRESQGWNGKESRIASNLVVNVDFPRGDA